MVHICFPLTFVLMMQYCGCAGQGLTPVLFCSLFDFTFSYGGRDNWCLMIFSEDLI